IKNGGITGEALLSQNKATETPVIPSKTPIKTIPNQLFIFYEKYSNQLNQNRNSAMVDSSIKINKKRVNLQAR
ncbi:hypothetical protein, partial [Pseudoalteromonas fuliginea]|uniref:hypothetical protein n=1 Tax=Pseudoalteromonas fuliginea TaxID=1872678 RepID=UPI0005FA2351